MIEFIHVENFRSLKSVDVPLPALSFVCGPNGSGKTNFSEALDFLSLAFQRGLSYAVADKGGFFNMCFRRERRSRGGITFRLRGTSTRGEHPVEVELEFTLQTKGQAIRSDYYVQNESYRFTINEPGKWRQINLWREEGGYRSRTYPVEMPGGKEDHVFRFVKALFDENRVPADSRGLLLPSPLESFLPFAVDVKQLTAIRVFRVNPRAARQAGTPSIFGELGKYGENLPSALDNIRINYPESYSRLEELVREVIPGLKSLRTDYTASRQMGLFLEESGFGTSWDAEELSDGTLMSIALFLALIDPRYKCVLIEEPENSLHPWILRKFLALCRELSTEKQIILTTQSPLVVSAALPEQLYIVERGQGETRIVRATDRESILPEMLRRQLLDLGTYWTSGALGGIPKPDDNTTDSDSEET